jgi:aconitate hydratase
MAPEYGATIAIFPVDQESIAYMRATGRPKQQCLAFEHYFKAQGLFGMPQQGQLDYSINLELDLRTIRPSVAGPKRPQDRIDLTDLKKSFLSLLQKDPFEGGYGLEKEKLHLKASLSKSHRLPLDEQEMLADRPTPNRYDQIVEGPFYPQGGSIGHGSVLIAAITSCTNTSNPSVMIAAGLLAKKAIEHDLSIDSSVKTSLAPGSRVVTSYLEKTGLQRYLDQLGFQTVAYGCTTCIGNSGPLQLEIEKVVQDHNLIAAAVLSGNRNFEARIHPAIKANFLMSPPLVIAFALAGRIDIDFASEPIGFDREKRPIFLKEIWPNLSEVKTALKNALEPETFQKYYSDFAGQNPKWNEIPAPTGEIYSWKRESSYIQEPTFFEKFELHPSLIQQIEAARALAIFGDSVTTDHISPAGAIKRETPAGQYLIKLGVKPEEFNSYGSRRGNDRVMTRGTFANVRIKNLMLPGVEGGETLYQSDRGDLPATRMTIFDASQHYAQEKRALLIIAGQEYGTGSSRDSAAKGTQLLGVRAVIAKSYERIHRSNLVGMGVLPLQFLEGMDAQTLHLDGTEYYDLIGLSDQLQPRQELQLRITRKNGASEEIPLKVRIDTPIEIDYYRHGGILPFILRQLLNKS